MIHTKQEILVIGLNNVSNVYIIDEKKQTYTYEF